MIKKNLHTLKFNWFIKRTRKFNWNFVPKYFIFDKEEPEVRFYDQGQENLMHKVRICPPNTWTTCNENLGFAQTAFWPYFIDCAPNLQQVFPPLRIIINLCNSKIRGYFHCVSKYLHESWITSSSWMIIHPTN